MFWTWLIIGVACIIVEMLTVGFFVIFFGIASIFTAFLSLAVPDNLTLQIAFFCILSVLLLIVGKKTLKKFFKVNEEVKPSTIDALIGKTAVVTKEINLFENGMVKVNGEIWSAISEAKHDIGDVVEIIAVDGVKLKVK